jgi:hypothetical protein
MTLQQSIILLENPEGKFQTYLSRNKLFEDTFAVKNSFSFRFVACKRLKINGKLLDDYYVLS